MRSCRQTLSSVFGPAVVAGMARKARIVDPADSRMSAQRLGNSRRILRVPQHAQFHCLETAKRSQQSNGDEITPVAFCRN